MLLLLYLAKFDKSNIVEGPFYFGCLMDLLPKSDCPTSIFSGLGVDGLNFFSLGQ